MKAMIQATTRRSAVRCLVCETHSRPVDVPWQQHIIGCGVRTVQLERDRERRPVGLLVATAA
jgi:hypothetical protein